MSIIAYTGLPGAYKTYSAVENWLIPALKDDRTVAHNLRVNEAACMAASGGLGRLVQIPRYDTEADGEPAGFERADELIELTPPGAVSIIDEIWQYWPSGVPVSKVPRKHLSFFKEHRQRLEPTEPHRAAEILIIDQDLGTAVAYWIRALVESTYIHTKLDDVGASNRFRVDIYKRAQSLDKPREKQFTRACYGKFKREVGDCYVTHAKTEEGTTFEAGLENKVDKRATIWGNFRIKAAIAAACILPFLVIGVYSQFKALGSAGAATKEPPGAAEPERAEQPPQPIQQQPAPQYQPLPPGATAIAAEQQAPAEPAEPELSKRWRLKGVIKPAGRPGIAIIASTTGDRRISGDLCESSDAGDWQCEIDGELVTMWSGDRESALSMRRPPGSYDPAKVAGDG